MPTDDLEHLSDEELARRLGQRGPLLDELADMLEELAARLICRGESSSGAAMQALAVWIKERAEVLRTIGAVVRR